MVCSDPVSDSLLHCVTCVISQPLCQLPFHFPLLSQLVATYSPSLGICFFLGADGNRYHLRCYMYQARDLPAMDKDSFSGRWEKGGEPGSRG